MELMAMKRSSLLFFAFLFEGGALLLGIILSRLLAITLLPVSVAPLRDMALGTLWAAIPFLFFVILVSKPGKRIPGIQGLRRLMRKGVHELFSHAATLDIAFISLLAGIGEEVLFRGVIQGKFGLFIASVLFGFAHAITPAYVVVATIMGLYIGFLYDYYGSLLVIIQLHFMYDLCALLWLKYKIEPDQPASIKRNAEF